MTTTLRVDAERNRKRVLSAARSVIARDGLDARIETIAREAGVGVGTVYRRFPHKSELLQAVLGELYDDLVAHMDGAADEDPWEAFAGTVRALGERVAVNLGLLDALGPEAHAQAASQAGRERLLAAMEGPLERAQAAGAVRADVDSADVVLIAVQLVKLPPASRERDPARWERLLAVALDGLRARPA
jgi:AcrR family transcriptional regulator